MRALVISVCLLVVALIHAAPLVGVLGGPRLAQLYGVRPDDVAVVVLLRHRAVLFGLVAAMLAIAALASAWQTPAIVAGLVSVLSFLVIAGTTPDHGDAIARIVRADLVALALLLVAGALRAWAR